jgi:hypothetical protein
MTLLWCAPVMRKAQRALPPKNPQIPLASRVFRQNFVTDAHYSP